MSKEKKRLEDVVLTIKHLTTGLSDALELFEMAKEEDDDASLEAVETDISSLKKEVEHLEFQRMFNQEHDEANCFLEIQAGAGGTEAQDWASMLERMYIKFAERYSPLSSQEPVRLQRTPSYFFCFCVRRSRSRRFF